MSSTAKQIYAEYWNTLKSSHAHHPGNRLRYHIITQAVDRLLPNGTQALSIVDVGCGDGELLRELRSTHNWKQVSGMDIVQSSVPFPFQRVDIGLPLSSALHGKYDVVICSEVVEHVQDDQLAVSNLFKMVKPGGLVLLTTQSGSRFRMEKEVLGHLRHYNTKTLAKMATFAGARNVHVRQLGFPWLNLQKILVHIFFPFVRTAILEKPPSKASLLLMSFLSALYKLQIPGLGPQIVLTATKE
jgi:2-polyprenyl-3-methyl-5-hydroxy-6-metoxy-1,4-benzoquinol methylase